MGWLSDIGNAVSSAAGAVGDAVEGVVDGVSDTVGDVVDTVVEGVQGGLGWANEWLCRHAGSVGCRLGNIVLGGISGLLEGAQDIVDKALDIVSNVGGLIGALLRGDLAGFIGKLGEIIADAVELVINIVRFIALGTFFGGIRDAWQAEDLRRFVIELLGQRFGNNPPLQARIRANIGLDGTGWGFPFPGTHRVMRLDSGTTPLWQWHKDGKIDLYAMAGLASFESFNIRRKRTIVRSTNADGTIESSLPINRWTLAHYIDSEGKEGRIRVYALSRRAVADFTRVATDKLKKLGIKLKWDDGGRFDLFGSTAVHDITTFEEFNFNRQTLGSYFISSGLRSLPIPEQCDLLSLATFKFVKGLGQASGRDINEGSQASSCSTPGRDDQCCNVVIRTTGAGVAYHDEWPQQIFRYVLAHEGGHYVGLCHFGHDGFQNIMYTPAEEANLSAADWGLFKYYLDNEPGFTLQDGKNVWRFLVSELVPCLDPQPRPGPIIT